MRKEIRIALPSKGVLQQGGLDLLAACGLKVFRPNPRQYEATIPSLPGVVVMFQRPGDIVVSVRQGSVDFGITGLDVLAEKRGDNGEILAIHDRLGFAPCTLNLAVPEDQPIHKMADLQAWAAKLGENGRLLRIATKFPNATGPFLDRHNIKPYKLITVEGTLEIAPSIGYADLIADLVSSGITLRDNHLRKLDDGQILYSEACLIANKKALQEREDMRRVARQLIEYIEAHLRAEGSYLVIANMRGDSPEAIAQQMALQPHIGGLQGPTIAPVVPPHNGSNQRWFAINIVVGKADLFQAIAELRKIGGSGVIVAPLTYIFEEEPERYKTMLAKIEQN